MKNNQLPDENTIKMLAYKIWEAEGKPHGEEKRHWLQACALAETEVDGYIPPVGKSRPLEPLDQLEPEITSDNS
jgi:hypothetical protein